MVLWLCLLSLPLIGAFRSTSSAGVGMTIMSQTGARTTVRIRPADTEADQPRSKEAYVSFLCGGSSYVPALMVLGKSLQNTRTERDMVLTVAGNISNNTEAMTHLREVGWKIRHVEVINSPKHPVEEVGKLGRWQCFYTKLQVFGMTEYKKIVQLDGDMAVFRNIDNLFARPNPPYDIAAVPNDRYPIVEVNTGLLVLTPSTEEHARLQHHVQSGQPIEWDGADQGLINQFFFDRIDFLPGVYNLMNAPTGDGYTMGWLQEHHPDAIRVVHYVNNKPWWCGRDRECTDSGKPHIKQLVNKWWAIYDTLSWQPEAEDINHNHYPKPYASEDEHLSKCRWNHHDG